MSITKEIEIVDKRHMAIQQQQQLTPMQELQMQIVRSGDIEKLKELRAIEREWKADQARELYFRAKAEFKKNPPTVIKNRIVNQGPGRPHYRHATLDECVSKIVPALAAVGLEHCWIPSRGQSGEVIVTCRLSGFGYHEDFTLSAPPDAGPGRNAIQAVSSTVTYLERYTLLAATGLAAADSDDDGHASGHTPEEEGHMDESIAADHLANIEAAATVEELQKAYFEARDAATAAKDKRALTTFGEAKNKQYRKIGKASHVGN